MFQLIVFFSPLRNAIFFKAPMLDLKAGHERGKSAGTLGTAETLIFAQTAW